MINYFVHGCLIKSIEQPYDFLIEKSYPIKITSLKIYYFFSDLPSVITLGGSRKNIAKKIIPRLPINKKVYTSSSKI